MLRILFSIALGGFSTFAAVFIYLSYPEKLPGAGFLALLLMVVDSFVGFRLSNIYQDGELMLDEDVSRFIAFLISAGGASACMVLLILLVPDVRGVGSLIAALVPGFKAVEKGILFISGQARQRVS